MNRIIFLFLMAGLLVLTACHNKEHKKHEATPRFKVTSPIKKDTLISNEYVCQIHSIQNIEVRALERGYIDNIYVDEGQMVLKGQMMFQIMPNLYKAELQRAQAEAEFAEIEYKNTKALADSNVVSANELALAKAKLDKAKAEMELAKVHLGFTQIKAPFSGRMDRLHVRKGSLVDEGELLTTFSDNSKMWVYFNVPEAEYLNYQTNQAKGDMNHVHLMMANGQEFPYQGVVETIESEFDNKTGNIPFRATFPNPDGLLRHGETGKLLMPVPYTDALIIPQLATFEILDKKYVYVLGEDEKVHAQQIVVAEEMPHLYIVSDGISEDDVILIDGLRRVREDDKIEPNFVDPEKVISELVLPAE